MTNATTGNSNCTMQKKVEDSIDAVRTRVDIFEFVSGVIQAASNTVAGLVLRRGCSRPDRVRYGFGLAMEDVVAGGAPGEHQSFMEAVSVGDHVREIHSRIFANIPLQCCIRSYGDQMVHPHYSIVMHTPSLQPM